MSDTEYTPNYIGKKLRGPGPRPPQAAQSTSNTCRHIWPKLIFPL
jgi:hypothetical protein